MKTSIIKKSLNKSVAFYVLGILLLIVIWIVLGNFIQNDLVIPSIGSVLKSLGKLLGETKTYQIILNTLWHLIIALLIGFIIASVLSILSYIFSWFNDLISPLITTIRIIPVATIIIIFLMVVGIKSTPYAITLLVIVPIMYEANKTGFKSISKGVIEEIKMNSATNGLVMKDIYLPLTFPYTLSGIISSFGLGLKVMVMAEFIAQSPNTIGYQLNQEKIFLETDNVFAWTIILIIFMLIIEFLLKKVQNKIAFYN